MHCLSVLSRVGTNFKYYLFLDKGKSILLLRLSGIFVVKFVLYSIR